MLRKFLTGSYNNNFVIHNSEEKRSITIEALKDPPKLRPTPAEAKPNTKLPAGASPTASPTATGKTLAKTDSKTAAAAGGKDKKSKTDKPAAATEVGSDGQPTPNVNQMDFGKKALHVAWHPKNDVVAVAGLNKLYLYQMT